MSEKTIEELFNEHFETLAPRLYSFFRHAEFDHEESLSMVDDVFLKYRDKGIERIHTSHEGYIFTLAFRRLYKEITKKTTKRLLEYRSLDDPIYERRGGKSYIDDSDLFLEDILKTLSPRQKEILILTCAGYSQKQIADKLQLKPNTINHHMKKIRESTYLQLVAGRIDPRGIY